MRALIRRHPLLSFIVLAYGLSWSWWVPMALRGDIVVPGGAVSHFPGLMGPMFAALLVPILAGDRAALRDIVRRVWLVSKPSWQFWLFSLSPLLFLALALGIAASIGAPIPSIPDFARFSGVPATSLWAVAFIVLIGNGFGEETGWRGFALPRLQQRFGPLGGTLLLALIWAGWHVPIFRVIETYRLMTPPMIVFGFCLGILSGALVLSHVARETGGSVLAASLWHLFYNMTAATAAARGIVAAVTTTCVMVWAVSLVVLERRRTRTASLLAVPAPPAA